MNMDSAKLNKMIIYSLLFIFSHSINAEPASPPLPSLHSHQNIIDTARQFIDANIDKSQFSKVSIQMSSLDPRLRLVKCPLPLTATLAPGSQFAGKSTVHLRCNSTTPWTVYLSARIKLYGPVIQTAEPLTKGHVLRASDLMEVERDLSQIKYGYFVSKDNLIGKQLKRRLPQNRTIKANHVKAQTLVKRGELVSIVAKNTGYSVKMTGTAMGSGARGERIRVKNTSSKRIVEGTIKEAGVVSIN